MRHIQPCSAHWRTTCVGRTWTTRSAFFWPAYQFSCSASNLARSPAGATYSADPTILGLPSPETAVSPCQSAVANGCSSITVGVRFKAKVRARVAIRCQGKCQGSPLQRSADPSRMVDLSWPTSCRWSSYTRNSFKVKAKPIRFAAVSAAFYAVARG